MKPRTVVVSFEMASDYPIETIRRSLQVRVAGDDFVAPDHVNVRVAQAAKPPRPKRSR